MESKGLIGDVLLCSRPQGAHISDVFIQPSTRQKQLKVDVELSGAAAGPAHFIAHLMDEQGNEEKTFEADANVPGRRAANGDALLAVGQSASMGCPAD